MQIICEAIEALNKEGGSSDEASISKYIKSHYHHDDLPMGHESLLSHHLGQLSAKGNIVIMDSNGCYKLAVSLISIPNSNDEEGKFKEVKKRRGRPSKKGKKLMVYGPKKRRGRPSKQIS